MRTLIQRLHTWAGLLTFVNLVVFGLVGLAATVESKRPDPPPEVRYVPFTVEPNLTDRQVAERVVELLHLSLATPIQKEVLQHDAAQTLVLDFWHVNGRHKVAVLEREGQLRVEVRRSSFLDYLASLHTTTAEFRSGDRRMQAWAVYNEFAMWCFLGMTASGVAMWLLSRPRHRWAQWSLGFGCALFAVLCLWTR